MIRLREAGAPLGFTDQFIRLDDMGGEPITRERFRLEVEDLLEGSPGLNLSGGIKYFIQEVRAEEDAATVAAFLRKYPRAGKVFNDAKRACREEKRNKAEFEKLCSKPNRGVVE